MQAFHNTERRTSSTMAIITDWRIRTDEAKLVDPGLDVNA
jgi:hypothetical protein